MREPLCPSLFSEYASGTMDEGLALVVASYLSFCPQARAQVGACQTMGGAMLETLCEPVEMGAQSLKHVLAQLDRTADPCAGKKAIMLWDDIALPPPLAALIGCRHAKLRWQAAGAGAHMAILPAPRASSHIIALRVASGAALPVHPHSGMALTLVLRGGYRDDAKHYAAVSLAVHEPDPARVPIADAQGCVCVVALSGAEIAESVSWTERMKALFVRR